MTHHAGSDEGLMGDEIDTLVYESGPDAYHDALVQEVERILVARAVAPDALRERVEALAAVWESELTHGNIRSADARYCWNLAAHELRTALEADQ